MPSLKWIGKKAIKNHHNEVKYHVIECKETIGDPESKSMIIKGDNLLALKSLLPYYASKIKSIYIDPPYNTGNTSWIYNDNVDSPIIKKWLKQVIDKDDLSRSDKWLCMIYPRLKLLQQLLREDGVIFISIDDAEFHNLKAICNEIFGSKNWLETFIWNTDGNIDNQRKIKSNHEYILAYAKDINKFKAPPVIDPNIEEDSKLFRDFIENTIVKNGKKNPPSDIVLPKGFPCDFESGTISKSAEGYPLRSCDIKVKNFKTQNEVTVNSGWSSKNLLLQYIANGYKPVYDTKGQSTTFKIKKTGAIYVYKSRTKNQSHVLSVLKNFGSTQQMNSFLSKLDIQFDYPKPINLIKYLLSLNDDPNGIFLDSFAGTGTTGHAVLEMNKEDNGNRKFILIEMLDYVKTITVKRNQKIIEGYAYKDKKGTHKVEGIGGGFQYCELSEELFDEFGLLNENITFKMLAKHIYFTEFGTALKESEIQEENFFAGGFKDKALYVFLDKKFTRRDLPKLSKDFKEFIVYADSTTLSNEQLKEQNIILKKLPFEIKDK